MIDFTRIIVTQNIYHTDGRLLVEKGAIGTISSRHRGEVGVVFDEGQEAYIERDGGGRLNQAIDFIHTAPVAHCVDNNHTDERMDSFDRYIMGQKPGRRA